MAPPAFTDLHNLCASKHGAEILFATDDWFAEAENLLKEEDAVWKEGVFTPCGKWMDGWETRRKRIPGHDWCIIKLGYPGTIEGVDVDTAHFTGNFVPQFSLQAVCLSNKDEELIPKRTCKLGGAASDEDMAKVSRLHSEKWQEIIPMQRLGAGYPETKQNYFPVQSMERWTHLRLNAFPDGGIARLRVYGIILPDLNALKSKTVDLLNLESGARCVAYSNAHYGHPRNLSQPGPSACMSDGWETSRQTNRPPILTFIGGTDGHLNYHGKEWAIYRFGCLGLVNSCEVDTSLFIGNSPHTICFEGLNEEVLDTNSENWQLILPAQKLIPNAMQAFKETIVKNKGPFTFLKITIVPDGGVSRIRVWGTACI